MVFRTYVPTENSLDEFIETYLSCEHAVLGELSETVSNWAVEHLGPDWHNTMLMQLSPKVYANWRSPGDPFYILKCIARTHGCVFVEALGGNAKMKPAANKVFEARNDWAHFTAEKKPSTIRSHVAQLADFASFAGLASVANVAESLKAMETVARKTRSEAISPLPVDTKKSGDEPKRFPRPRIGDPWIYEFPGDVYGLEPKLKDAKHRRTGASIRRLFPSEAEAEIALARWFRLGLSPLALYVDSSDGATIGFLEGHPYLLGYSGLEPPQAREQYRGFFEPEVYEFTGSDIVDQETRTPGLMDWEGRDDLIRVLVSEEAEAGTSLQVTDFGDLVLRSDSGPQRIATIR